MEWSGSQLRSKKCEAATSESFPGNANLPIGDGTEAQNANREIGVPGVPQSTTELKVNLGHYPILRRLNRIPFEARNFILTLRFTPDPVNR